MSSATVKSDQKMSTEKNIAELSVLLNSLPSDTDERGEAAHTLGDIGTDAALQVLFDYCQRPDSDEEIVEYCLDSIALSWNSEDSKDIFFASKLSNKAREYLEIAVKNTQTNANET